MEYVFRMYHLKINLSISLIFPPFFPHSAARNATLYLTGGNNDPDFVPKADDEDIVVTAALAMANNVVAGCLFHIPNQHVIFASDPKQQSRGEDAVIAFTWSHFLNDQSNPEWLLRFPMVKASVRAMDTITAFGKSFGYSLDYFVVAGASKRGYATKFLEFFVLPGFE
jgi:PhoPQ-activated pathogenicity-related protein